MLNILPVNSSSFHRAVGMFAGFAGMVFCAGCALTQPWRLSGVVETHGDLLYIEGSRNPKHRLDLFVPRQTAPENLRPVLLFVHGGFWKNQDRRYYRPLTGLYWNIGYAFAQRGYVTAVVSYRLFPETKIAGQREDVTSAARWLSKNAHIYGGDPERLFVMGHSAGGHLAALTGVDGTPRVRAVAALSPILDIADLARRDPPEFDHVQVDAVFGDNAEDWKAHSPSHVRNRNSPPMIVVAGSRDYDFILDQGRRQAAQPGCSYVEIDGYDHADMVLNLDRDDAVTATVADFFEQQAREQ